MINVLLYSQYVLGAIVDMMRERDHRISFVYRDPPVRADMTDPRETAQHQMICSTWWRNHEMGHVGMYCVLIGCDVRKDEIN